MSTVFASPSIGTTASRVGERILYYSRHVWFRFAYPAALWGTALSRRGTVAFGCYCLGTLLLTFIANFPGERSDPCTWRRAHVLLLILFLIFFAAAITLEVVCATTELSEAEANDLGLWGFGGIHIFEDDEDSDACGGTLRALPEAIAVCAAVIGWLLGADAESVIDGADQRAALDAEAGSVPQPSPTLLTDFKRGGLVALLLITCAMLDCNLFGAAYHAAVLSLMLSFAWLQSPRPALARLVRGVLLATVSLQLLAVIACSFIMRITNESLPPSSVVMLLGAGRDSWCFSQCLGTFVLFQVLLLYLPPSSLPVDPSEIRVEHRDNPWLGVDHESVRTSLVNAEVRPERQVELSEAVDTNFGRVEENESVPSSGARRRAAARPLKLSALQMTTPRGSPSARSNARTPRSSSSQPTILEVLTHPVSPRSALTHPMTSAVKVMLPWIISVTGAMGIYELLPFMSLLAWPLMWPTLPTLLLLLCSLLLLHSPVERLPWWLMHSALAYEASYSVVVYAYNVYCKVASMPPSAAPCTYTWLEVMGLQNFRRTCETDLSLGMFRMLFISGQAACLFALAINCRFLGFTRGEFRGRIILQRPNETEATSLEIWLWDWSVATLRSIFALSRPVTVAVVIGVAFVSLEGNEAVSLFGLGYMLWVLVLAARGYVASSEIAGWDSLRANVPVWRGLLLYAQALMVALFCWQIFGTEDVPFVGLRRSSSGIAMLLWPHMCIAVFAAVQIRTIGASVAQPSYLLSSHSVVAQFLWYVGIFIEMGLLFAIVFIPPTSIDSFLFLLFFCCVVGIEQFSPRRRRRNYVLFLIAIAAAGLTPLRYCMLIPKVQLWLSQALQQAPCPDLWSILAVLVHPDERAGATWKIAITAVLLLFTCIMHRLYSLRCQSDDELTFDFVPQHPGVVRAIILISRGSTSMLMFVASFLMIKENLLSRVQLVVLTVLLLGGRKWSYAGAIISACSMGCLLAQYISRFRLDFIELTDEQAQYLGFVWDKDLVASEVVLLLCGITAGVLARTRKHLEFNASNELLWARWRLEVAKHSAQIGATAVLLTAVCHRSMCSTATTFLLVAFAVSRDSSRSLTPKRANVWMLIMGLTLAISLWSSWAMELWRPPLPFHKPDYEDVSKWWVCSMYDSKLFVFFNGTQCIPSFDADCLTEQYRCGTAWCEWIGFSRKGDLLSTFICFFVVCMVRKGCLIEVTKAQSRQSRHVRSLWRGANARSAAATMMSRAVARSSAATQEFETVMESAGTSVPALQRSATHPLNGPSGVSDSHVSNLETARGSSFHGVASSVEPVPSSTEGVQGSTSESCDRHASSNQDSQLQTPVGGLHPAVSEDNGSMESMAIVFFRTASVVMWLCLIGAIVAQPHTDAIAVIYLILLFLHVQTLEAGTNVANPFGSRYTCEHAFGARVRVLRYIRIFNLVVSFVWIWFQCPLCPCPFELTLQPVRNGKVVKEAAQGTYFMSPKQCLEVQNRMGSQGDMKNMRSILAVILQCIGLRKTGDVLDFDVANLWNALVFAAALTLSVICSRWGLVLSSEIQTREEQMQAHEGWYIEYLTAWRGLEISRIDIKHDVLHTKLNQLIMYMNEMRLVWSNRRPAPDEEEEHRRAEEAHILDLCLECGVQPDRMEEIVKEFNAVVAEEARNAEGALDVRMVETRTQATVDKCALEYFSDCGLARLTKITYAELHERKERLLDEVRQRAKKECESMEASLASDEASESEAPTTARESEIASAPESTLASAREGGELTPSARPHIPRLVLPTPDNKSQRLESDSPRHVTIPEQDEVTDEASAGASQDADAAENAGCCERFWTVVQENFRRACEASIDDLLFKTSSDQTLWDHRRGNSLLLLAYKAFQSQSLLLLVVAAIVQFATYVSMFSAVTVVLALLSLYNFPHSPPLFWRCLKWYNMILIIIKMLFQLPIWCSDGSFRGGGCSNDFTIPWVTALGLRKVHWDAADDASSLAFSNLFEALWADFLVCTLLFWHWHVLRLCGRLGSPVEIRRFLGEDCFGKAVTGNSAGNLHFTRSPPSSLGSSSLPGSLPLTTRRTDTSETPVMRLDGMQLGARSTSLQSSSSQQPLLEDNGPVDGETASANEPISCWRKIWNHVVDAMDTSVKARRPALDLFTIRFWLALVCLVFLLVGWPYLSGSSRSFASSVSAGNFSGLQVLAVTSFFAMIIVDRALYSWSMQTSAFLTRGGGYSNGAQVQWQVEPHIMAPALQRLVLATQLIVLHAVCIAQWFSNESPTKDQLSLFHSPCLLIFYLLYMTFLALTSVQLRFQVYMTRGGLGLTHSTDFFTRILYKVYGFTPFIEEVRALTDWTMTNTSLDFFMWMKLEDAQQGLYRDRCDMELREAFEPGEARPCSEKFFQGFLLVVALFFIMAGPLIFFSSLNFLMQPNEVSQGTLSASLSIRTSQGDTRRATLYESGQSGLVSLDKEQVMRFVHDNKEFNSPDAITLQNISFPESSDSFWLISPALRQQFAELLSKSSAKASIVFEYTTRTSAGRLGAATYRPDALELDKNQTKELLVYLNDTEFEGSRTLMLPNAMASTLHLDSGDVLTPTDSSLGYLGSNTVDVNLTLDSSPQSLPFWSLTQLDTPEHRCQPKNNGPPEESCQLTFQVASDRIAPDFVSGGASSSTFTVTGIYIGVVYTIGRFLRLAFQDSAQRIMYEELEDTKILLDLCNGIYIARIQGDLEKEWELYFELIRIYRSPELLLAVSQRKDHKTRKPLPAGDEVIRRTSGLVDGNELRRRLGSSSSLVRDNS